MSRDIREIEREIAQAARWAVKWRMLQKEAIQFASGMGDPEVRQNMLFISDCYQRLGRACRGTQRERLVAFKRHMKKRETKRHADDHKMVGGRQLQPLWDEGRQSSLRVGRRER